MYIYYQRLFLYICIPAADEDVRRREVPDIEEESLVVDIHQSKENNLLPGDSKLLSLKKRKDEESRLKDEEIRGLKTEKKEIEEKYKDKSRGKKLETENKELKEENKKINNELKELKKDLLRSSTLKDEELKQTEKKYEDEKKLIARMKDDKARSEKDMKKIKEEYARLEEGNS